jgi:hypothetical protein
MPTQKRLYLSLSTILSIVYLLSIFCLSLVYLLSTHHSLCIRFHIKDTRREKYGDENAKTLTSMTHMGGILEKRGGPWTLWSIWEFGDVPEMTKILYHVMSCNCNCTYNFRRAYMEPRTYQWFLKSQHGPMRLRRNHPNHPVPGHLKGALDHYGEAMNIRRDVLGDKHPKTLQSIGKMDSRWDTWWEISSEQA